MRRKPVRENGFTLLEVMIALAIIAGVVTTVIAVVNHHLAIIARDREEGVAILLARQKVDEITAEMEVPDRKDGSFAPSHPGHSWELVTDQTEVPGLRKMTLTVAWEGKKRSLALVRYVAK